MTEEQKAFVNELTALTRKHGIAISGCGCCGSPWLETLDEDDRRGEYEGEGDGYNKLEWNAKLIRHSDGGV